MREYRLSELYDNVSTNSLSRALLYEDGDVLNLHYGDIHLKYSGLLDINKAELPFALKTDYKFKESSRMETGDVIFADAAEDYEGIGKAVEIGQTGDTPSYAGLHTIHLKRRTDNLASGYMGYLSQAYAFRRKVWFIAQGAKVLGISSKELLKQSIVIPDITEQNIIVSRLKAVDQKIDLLTKKKEALQTYKKGLMQKIFSQELRFKREDGTDYPEWERLELIEVLDYEQPTKYIVDSTEYSDDYKTPVLTAGKSFILGYTDEEHNHFTNIPVVIFDDFTTDFKYVDFEFKVKSSAMKILRPKENVNVRFVFDAMKTIRFPKGEHKRYWISEYSFMKIPYPSQDEQQKIASLSVKFDQKIDAVDKEISSTQKLKQGLLQQMFV